MVATICWRLAVVLLQFAADQEIELLVGAAHFDVGLERDGIVALRQRVEQLVHGDRDAFLVAFGEIVALEDARDGVLGGELDGVHPLQRLEPLAVEADLGLFGIEDFEDLRLVGLGVLLRCPRGSWAGG